MNALKNDFGALLKVCLKKNRPELLYILDDDNTSSIDLNVVNNLREAVLDELILNGFNSNNITEYGVKLEELIDALGRLIF